MVLMKTIDKLNIKPGTRVLLRTDFNVSIENGKIMDDFRIRASLPTIQYLQDKEAKIIIISHLGRPKGKEKSLSLAPVAEQLEKLLNTNVLFLKDYIEAKKDILKMKNGSVILMENLRFEKGELSGDKNFAKDLAEFADVYVNDAFGVAHRKHASLYALPSLLPAVAGLLLQKEVEVLNEVIKNPIRPLIFIIGGAKVETKLKSLVKIINKIDGVCIGGLLANSILAARGIAVGKSRLDKNILKYIDGINLTDTKFHLPLDVVVSLDDTGKSFSRIAAVGDVREDEMILDAGPETVKLFSNIISEAGTVIWNGPLGLLEVKKFSKGTHALALSLKNTKARVIVGGGDIMRAIDEVGVSKYIYYSSTGGGSMLEYLADGTLPALEVLK